MGHMQSKRSSQQRMQIRCSVDAVMTDLFGPLSELPPALRGRELVAAARIGWVLRSGSGALAAMMAAAARECISPAMRPHVTDVFAADAKVAHASVPAASEVSASASTDLSVAAAQQATAAFDPAFFSSAPPLQ